ncbi:MAG: WG repeat-containing protein, partial [Candidatus Accumulibacter sp.]|nr:WG repeat-containing protein [Accumulibacter sp.]
MQRIDRKTPLRRLLLLVALLPAALPLMAEELTYLHFRANESGSVSVRFEGHRDGKDEDSACLMQNGERRDFVFEGAIPACSIASYAIAHWNKDNVSACDKTNGDLIIFDQRSGVPICLLKSSDEKKDDVSGYLKQNDELLVFDKAEDFDADGIAKVRQGGLYGFLDRQGNFLATPRFDDAGYFWYGLAEVKVGEKWGYIDKTGALVIPARFEDTGAFAANGLAAAREKGKWGYIDRKGEWVIPPAFNEAFRFSENGTARVRDYPIAWGAQRIRWRILDAKGKTLKLLYDTPKPLFQGKVMLLNDRTRQKFLSQILVNDQRKIIPLAPYRIAPQWSERGNLLRLVGEEEDAQERLLTADGRILVPPEGDFLGHEGDFLVYGSGSGKNWNFTLLDKNGKLIARIASDSGSIRHLREDWLSYRRNGKYGLVHSSGRILKAEFDGIYPFENGFARAVLNGVFCYLDATGKIAFKTQRKATDGGFGDFMKAGLVRFKENDKYGLMNAKGEVVVSPRYVFPPVEIMDMVAGEVKRDEGYGLVDAKGVEVIAPRFRHIDHHNANFAFFMEKGSDSLRGVIGRGGRILSEARFSATYPLSEDYLQVELKGGFAGIMDKQGRILIEPRYWRLTAPDALGLVRFESPKSYGKGVLDLKGETRIELQFKDLGPFTANGLARAQAHKEEKYADGRTYRVEGKWGYIDVKGQWAIAPRFEEAEDFSKNGLAWVASREDKSQTTWRSQIDAKGEQVFPRIRPFKGENGRYGFVDAQGKIVQEARFSEIRGFYDNGLGVVKHEGRWAFIDPSGKLLTDFLYGAPQIYEHGGKTFTVASFPDPAMPIEAQGFVNDKGTLVAYARVAPEPIGPYLKVGNAKGQWGLVDRSGAPVVPIAFEDIRYYSASRDLFLARSGGRSGYLDAKGKWVV